MRSPHAGRLPRPRSPTVVLAALLAVAGCRPDARIEERAVTFHTPRACALDPDRAFAQLYPAGDFEPPSAGGLDALYLRERGKLLANLPRDTRALLVDSSQGTRSWRGLAAVPTEGKVDVLLWPKGEACRLTTDVERRRATTVGALDDRWVLVVGGRSVSGASNPRSYLVDLTIGEVRPLRFGIGSPRDRPTITPFGRTEDRSAVTGALVAGGRVPDTGAPIDTAEVFAFGEGEGEGDGDFLPAKIAIEARADHAAVTLRTGETLLVGGVGPAGLLRTMELVDPRSRRAISQGVARLRVPRRNPSAIRLASGEILVGGGTDANGVAVPTIETFLPDASGPTKREIELKPTDQEAFVALPGGGALIVMSYAPTATTVWVITGDGALEPGHSFTVLGRPQLFSGADGAPVLWTGARWVRWAPWSGAFETIGEAPETGPKGSSCDLAAHACAGTTTPCKDDAECVTLDAAAPDGGLVVWLADDPDQGMHLWGFRHAARGEYQSVPRNLLANGPAYLTPDRVPGESARYDDVRKGLVLANGASALVSDATFARVAIDVESPSGSAPFVVLKDDLGAEVVAGGPDCPLVVGSRLRVERDHETVRASVDRGPFVTCKTALAKEARVTVAVRSGPSPAFVTSLTATRVP